MLVFLYKIINRDDRDCVVYIPNTPMSFECGHYFSSVYLQGSCFFGGKFEDYSNIKTILTENEYQQLIDFNNAITNLGYGISIGDDRYNKGIALCKAIQSIYDKLNSKENEELFEKVWLEEKQYLMEEFSLDDEEIELILDNYTLDYKDRSIIGYIFDNAYDCGYEEAFQLGISNNNIETWRKDIMENYFDFESFGESIGNDECHCTLPDGRIVSLNY